MMRSSCCHPKFRNVDNLLLAYDPQPGAGERLPDNRDNTTIVPKAIVVDDPSDHYIANPRSTVVLLAEKAGFARRSGVIELSEQHAVDPAG